MAACAVFHLLGAVARAEEAAAESSRAGAHDSSDIDFGFAYSLQKARVAGKGQEAAGKHQVKCVVQPCYASTCAL